MSNPFCQWTDAEVDAHNLRVRPQPGALMAEAKERDTLEKTTRLRAANGKSEAEIQQSIAAYLDSHGRECFYVWHRMDQPTTCRVGTPDFVGWIRGKPFALEVKRPGAKETREQAGELLRGQLAGARVAVVHSLAEAAKALAGI